MALTIKTNNIPRQMIYGYQLTEKEKANFDYIDATEFDAHDFFRYRGAVYDPSEFMRVPEGMFGDGAKWQGYSSDSHFSGVLIRYTDDAESVIVASYYS
jgi:hypothetical protein